MARDQDLEEMLHQPPPSDDLGVQDYLNSFKDALTRGDGAAIAEMWETPAFVLGQDMARVVNEPEDGLNSSAARASNTQRSALPTRALKS